MISPGLLSITFRQLAPQEIVDLVTEAKLKGIEWGGDVHVPHGDLVRAKEVRKMTADAGLAISAYGSYYRLDYSESTDKLSFEKVLETAKTLGAPTIRVWAGKGGSAEMNAEGRRRAVKDAQRIGDLAAKARISISFEYHVATLTDTNESASQLLAEVNHPNVYSFWQPPVGEDIASCIEGLKMILPRLTNVHVYHWSGNPAERRPLAEGEEPWRAYLEVVQQADAPDQKDRFASLEFVKDDSPEVFMKDAATLRKWVEEEFTANGRE